MSSNSTINITPEQMTLFSSKLEDLRDLLEKQIELARKGDISQVEALSSQTSSLVELIVQAGILQLPEFKNRQHKLQRLYKQLCLAVSAQKAGISEKLNRLRKGRKTIGAYLGNI